MWYYIVVPPSWIVACAQHIVLPKKCFHPDRGTCWSWKLLQNVHSSDVFARLSIWDMALFWKSLKLLFNQNDTPENLRLRWKWAEFEEIPTNIGFLMTSSLWRGFAAKEGNIFKLSSYLETAEEAALSCRDTFFSRSRATLASAKCYSKMLLLLLLIPCLCMCIVWISTATLSLVFHPASDCDEYQMANATLATPKCYFCYCSSYMYWAKFWAKF